jgi:hypothetical protein
MTKRTLMRRTEDQDLDGTGAPCGMNLCRAGKSTRSQHGMGAEKANRTIGVMRMNSEAGVQFLAIPRVPPQFMCQESKDESHGSGFVCCHV